MKVRLIGLSGAGPRQTSLITQACGLLESALNHPEFASRVTAARYLETRFRTADRRVISVPPDGIVKLISSGEERGTSADGILDVHIELARLKKGIRGSTTPGKLPWRTAYWFIDACVARDNAAVMAGHIIHEWLHVAGFFHFPNNSARHDVPYNVGAIVESLLTTREANKSSNTDAMWLEEVDLSVCGEAGNQDADIEDPNSIEGPN